MILLLSNYHAYAYELHYCTQALTTTSLFNCRCDAQVLSRSDGFFLVQCVYNLFVSFCGITFKKRLIIMDTYSRYILFWDVDINWLKRCQEHISVVLPTTRLLNNWVQTRSSCKIESWLIKKQSLEGLFDMNFCTHILALISCFVGTSSH